MESSSYDAASLGARLRKVRGAESLSDFSDQFGVHKNTLARYEKGENLPDAGFLADLCEKLGLNPTWLLTGKGPKETQKAFPEATAEGLKPIPLDADRYVYIPLYNVVASGGGGSFAEEEEEAVDALAFKRDWIRTELKANPRDLVLVNMTGESMEPTLGKNDVLLANQRIGQARTDGIYLLRTGDALLVKRIQFLPDGDLRVISDNQAYEPFTVKPDTFTSDFQIIGRVVWAGRKF